MAESPTIQNKKAGFEYAFIQTFEAGMVLQGSEVKSLREGKANLTDAYCTFQEGKLYIKNMHISPYPWANQFNHEPKRARPLLLKKHEIKKIREKLKDVGLTVVPTKLYFSDKGWVKVEIALAKGKKTHDKRETIKTREVKRNLARGES